MLYHYRIYDTVVSTLWSLFQNRMEIFKGAKDEMLQEGFIHKLVIKKLGAKDAGNYTLSCDGVTTSCNLAVKGKTQYLF